MSTRLTRLIRVSVFAELNQDEIETLKFEVATNSDPGQTPLEWDQLALINVQYACRFCFFPHSVQ